MTVTLLTKEDVQVLDEKLTTILELLTSNKPVQSKAWLKSAEVKIILNCSDATLKNYRDQGRLPYSKIGGSYYYSFNQVNELFENTKISKHGE